MRNSRKWVRDIGATPGRTLTAFVLVAAIGGLLMAPPLFAKEHRGHHERWRHHRHYGYYYGYPYRPYGYYCYPAPTCAASGINLVFPIHIR